MNPDIQIPLRIDFFSLIIFLGVFQGYFISLFFLIKKSVNRKANIYLWLFLMSACLLGTELLLNYSGYMAEIIWLDNFTEPINFMLVPAIYLYAKTSIRGKSDRRDTLHFIPFILYLIYQIPYYLQSNEWKLSSFIYSNRPHINAPQITPTLNTDILGLRDNILIIIGIYFILYAVLIVREILVKYKSFTSFILQKQKQPELNVKYPVISYMLMVVVFIFVETYFGRDIGDYIIAIYIGITMYILSIHVIRKSMLFANREIAYKDNTISEKEKRRVISKIDNIMIEKRYFVNNRASLSEMSEIIGESKHLVSQIINQELNVNFFGLLAKHRVEEACRILDSEKSQNITIEELSELVGYNSKTSLNTAFKKIKNMTPSAYRKRTNL